MELYGQCSDKLLIGGLYVCVCMFLLIKKVMPTTLVVINNGSGWVCELGETYLNGSIIALFVVFIIELIDFI